MWKEILFTFSGEIEFVIRLILSSICGGLVGLERSRKRKEAGIRTHIIVALGAAMMMIVSKYGFFDVLQYQDITLDASRLAANVVTGISFLGAGVIFVRGVSIRGLTTAAGIWATAGIGLAIGAGMYIVGIFTTILIVFIQIVMHRHLKKFDGPVYETISVTYTDGLVGLDGLKPQLEKHKIMVHNIKMEKQENNVISVTMQISRENGMVCTDLATILAKDPHVTKFSI